MSNDFVIETNVPFPKLGGRGDRIYPFPDMSIGSSIVLNFKGTIAARAYGTKHGWKFTSRKISDTEFRVWRVA